MDLILGTAFLLIAKIFVIIGLLVYCVFAFVIVKQVKLMNTTVETDIRMPLKLFSYVHLIFALSVLFMSIVIL